jgi:hypothetical protein
VSEETSGDREYRWIPTQEYFAVGAIAIPDQVTMHLGEAHLATSRRFSNGRLIDRSGATISSANTI